jgi:hypothetical protein
MIAALSLDAPHQPIQQLSRKVYKFDRPWPAAVSTLVSTSFERFFLVTQHAVIIAYAPHRFRSE